MKVRRKPFVFSGKLLPFVVIAFLLLALFVTRTPKTKNIWYNFFGGGQGSGGGSHRVNDVLLDPYVEPLRDDGYFLQGGIQRFPGSHMPMAMPMPTMAMPMPTMAMPTMAINVPTQLPMGLAEYRQIGILTRLKGSAQDTTILPLMGRPLLTHRDKWNFYTMNDKNNMIKLPMTFKGKSCTNEYGCDNIYNGDTVFVEGYQEAFKATVYDNNVLRYI